MIRTLSNSYMNINNMKWVEPREVKHIFSIPNTTYQVGQVRLSLIIWIWYFLAQWYHAGITLDNGPTLIYNFCIKPLLCNIGSKCFLEVIHNIWQSIEFACNHIKYMYINFFFVLLLRVARLASNVPLNTKVKYNAVGLILTVSINPLLIAKMRIEKIPHLIKPQ